MQKLFKTTLLLLTLLCSFGLYNTAQAQTDCFANSDCTCTVTITVNATANWSAQVGRFGAGVCDNISGSAGTQTFTYTVDASTTGNIGYAIIFSSGNPISSVQVTGCGININQSGGFIRFRPVACETNCCAPPSSFTITPSTLNPNLLKICTDAYPDECGLALYHVRWRAVGTSAWTDINGGFSDNCQVVGEFEPCTEYEIQMNVYTDECNGYTDYSPSQFYTTPCIETCCEAPSSFTIEPSTLNPGLLEICTDAYPDECGLTLYHVRWRAVGTSAWTDINGGFSDECQFVGEFEPCTEYEIQMNVYTDGCDGFSDYSPSQFYTTDCTEDCCEAPSSFTIEPSTLNPGLLEICTDAYPDECGLALYHVRWRAVGTSAWIDINGGFSDECQFVGEFEPCTEYEIQMNVYTDGCDGFSDYSPSQFYTTDCTEDCCEAPSSFTIEPSTLNPGLLEICTDAYPDECGLALYHVRWRAVGSLAWIDINGGFSDECQFVGEFEPCTEYEIQMNVYTDGCDGFSDYSPSQFYTTDCDATDCFAQSNCTCNVTVSITPLINAAWTGTIGRLGAGPCDQISGPAGATQNFVYTVDANAAGSITYGYFPSGAFVPVNIVITGCGVNVNVNLTSAGLVTFNPTQNCLTGDGGADSRSDLDAQIAAIENGAWGDVYVKNVEIFPNPANEVLQIRVNNENATNNELIDVNGKVVSQTIINANGTASISVSDMPAGIYIMRTTNRITGEVIANKKIVIKH